MQKSQNINSTDSTPEKNTDTNFMGRPSDSKPVKHYRKRFSVVGTGMLWRIASGQELIKVEDLDPETYDELAVEFKAIQADDEGILHPTETGARITDTGMAVVYPFGPSGTIGSYDATLSTMSIAAKNTFTSTLANKAHEFFQGVHSDRVSRFTQSMIDGGVMNKLGIRTKYNLYSNTRESIMNNRDKNMKSIDALFETYDDIITLEAHLDQLLIKTIVEKTDITKGDINLSGGLKLDSVEPNDKSNDLVLNCTDIYSGDKREIMLSDTTLTIYDKKEIVNNISIA